MKIEIGFGEEKKYAELPDEQVLGVLKPNHLVQGVTGRAAVQMALANPVGTSRLRDIASPGEKIVIVTSDITRPMPSFEVLPLVIDELNEGGIVNSDITIVLARGSHRAHTEEEKRKLIGSSLYGQISCVDSDPNDCLRIGRTSKGTPVDIDKTVYNADKIILLGNIEYHYFGGYSGGAEALLPGTSSIEAMEANYSHMIEPGADIGRLDGNPIKEDLEEVAKMCDIDFIVNVVLDENKKIVYAIAGDVKLAHRQGCEFLDRMCKVEIPEKADIVIVSQGGAPKDINLYQLEKALENAKYAVKDGGTLILVGSCKEGMGNVTFEDWMVNAESPEALRERISREFKLGGHKAASMAMIMERAKISLVSEMNPEFVKKMFVKPYTDLQEAVYDALAAYGKDAKIIVMPFGGATLPTE